jgi:hypothetical protein
MFDTLVVSTPRAETQFVTREVHEHRAPTDASVALLKEMEAAARDKITAGLVISDNTFNCVVHFEQTAHDDRLHAMATFDVNGRRYVTRESIQMVADLGKSKSALVMKLRDAMAVEIAGIILAKGLESIR